jgi:hypothetical protein
MDAREKLIELADFPTAESTRCRDGEDNVEWACRTFYPSFPGVHICGADHEENRFFTILDLPTRTDEQARALWEEVRAEYTIEGDDFDLVVDLNSERGHEDEFQSTRQMLPRLYASLRAAMDEKQP